MLSGKRKNKVKEEQSEYGSSSGPFVLDTHVWIWMEEGHERLKNSKSFGLIRQSIAHSHLKVSPISIWEISMLEARSRVRLSLNTFDWVNNALENPSVQLAPITPEIAWDAGRIPGNFHGDPADRILVATARALKGKLVTADKKILEYARENFVKVLTV